MISDSFEEFVRFQQDSESYWLGCLERQETIQELAESSLVDSEQTTRLELTEEEKLNLLNIKTMQEVSGQTKPKPAKCR